jgi:hypothetical protein
MESKKKHRYLPPVGHFDIRLAFGKFQMKAMAVAAIGTPFEECQLIVREHPSIVVAEELFNFMESVRCLPDGVLVYPDIGSQFYRECSENDRDFPSEAMALRGMAKEAVRNGLLTRPSFDLGIETLRHLSEELASQAPLDLEFQADVTPSQSADPYAGSVGFQLPLILEVDIEAGLQSAFPRFASDGAAYIRFRGKKGHIPLASDGWM